MKFYAPSHLLQSHTLLEALQQIRQLGFVGSEIWFEHFEVNPPTVKQLRSLGLEYSFHAPSWDVNPASRIKAARAFAAKLILESLQIAAEIAAGVVVVHPGYKSNPKNEFSAYEEYLLDFLDKITSRGRELGLLIAMEIMDETPNQLVNNSAVANKLTTTFPSLGICFDFAHAGRFSDPLVKLATVKNVRHFHLSNTTKEVPHIALAAGHLNIAEILAYLQQNYPQATVAVEGFDPADELGLLKGNLACLQSLGFCR